MVELSLVEDGDGLVSTVYLVRSSNGQPIKFCFSDDELAAFISNLRDDVVDEIKHSESQE